MIHSPQLHTTRLLKTKNVYIILTYVNRVNFSSIFSNGSWSLPFLTTLRIISLKTENILTEISNRIIHALDLNHTQASTFMVSRLDVCVFLC